jgi:hypothetical protein
MNPALRGWRREDGRFKASLGKKKKKTHPVSKQNKRTGGMTQGVGRMPA